MNIYIFQITIGSDIIYIHCYFRRRHERLEQEQADVENKIRLLMAHPNWNKTDSDKVQEDALISRLVQIVELRNNVIESLENDRLRETREDIVSNKILICYI